MTTKVTGSLAARLTLVTVALAGLARPQASPSPRDGEVPLSAEHGWDAYLVYENTPSDVGIWTVRPFPVFEQYAAPEIVGLDDLGRCHVLVSYSGKWTPNTVVHDHAWLGGLAHGDIDPRFEGAELYMGGQRGHLYQVLPYREGVLDARRIAVMPGREIHTVVAGELDPRHEGRELLVFTRPGGLYRVTPTGPDGRFETTLLAELPGRVRDAIALGTSDGGAPWIATVARSGKVSLLRLGAAGLEENVVHEERMGAGRLALGESDGRRIVLYSGHDDGRVLRHEGSPGGEWRSETIYLGPQGNRGVAAGRFFEDPEVESLAVFGYSKKLQLLHRKGDGPWEVQTVFVDRDRGHALSACEVDGRNGTDEIVASGYGGRIVMLARPPGYGLGDPPVDTEDDEPEDDDDRPLRVAVTAGERAMEQLSPLDYQGGFETKTLVYETLVRRAADGRIVPALAESWRFEDEGRVVVFRLREGARFHDGSPVTAEDVRIHFRRWVGLPEHSWLRANDRIVEVAAVGERELRIVLDRPHALLPELCAINPCAIRGPGALDREGAFVKPVGTGPFRWVGVGDDGRVLRLERHVATEPWRLDLVRCEKEGDEPLAALLAGEVDAVVGGWLYRVPRERVAELAEDEEFRVTDGPGSSVVYLSFELEGGPTARREVRETIAAAVDRQELIREVELGLADACTTWAAPTIAIWPQRPAPQRAVGELELERPLTIATSARGGGEALGDALVAQLARAGVPARLAEDGEDGADLRVEVTWGVPYDPYLSLVARFLPPPQRPTAARDRFRATPRALVELVEAVTREPEQPGRTELYGRIQQAMDEEIVIVPLYVPRRVAIVRQGLGTVPLDHDIYRMDVSGLGGDD